MEQLIHFATHTYIRNIEQTPQQDYGSNFEIKIPFVRKSFNLITSGLASSYHEKTSLLSFTLPLLAATTLGDLTASAITTLVTQSLGIQ